MTTDLIGLDLTDRLLAAASLAYVGLAGVAGVIMAAACLLQGPLLKAVLAGVLA